MSDCGVRLRKPSAEGSSGRKQYYAAPSPPKQQASVLRGAGNSMDSGPENQRNLKNFKHSNTHRLNIQDPELDIYIYIIYIYIYHIYIIYIIYVWLTDICIYMADRKPSTTNTYRFT